MPEQKSGSLVPGTLFMLIFSLINTVMLRSLPVSDPEQLVQLLTRYPGEPRLISFSWRHYVHLRDHNQSFSDLLAVSRARVQVTREEVEPETIEGSCCRLWAD
jgi:hypothetical protein